MSAIEFTPAQKRAVTTTGHSVIVSAAAGSGKTAVLAERCAYLVSDAPAGERCNVDELLVLTFTDAAAAEMRSRIVQALFNRWRSQPGNARLREQIALVDTARISTIHSFCFWLIRRWFSELELDPAATLLDADEALLLQGEVLDSLFRDLYAAYPSNDRPLGEAGSVPAAGAAKRAPLATSGPGLGARFAELVDIYGLGDDREIAALIHKLGAFLASLPQPDQWLDESVASVTGKSEQTVLRFLAGLRTECMMQAEHADRVATNVERGDDVGHAYAVPIRAYVDQLRVWSGLLPEVIQSGSPSTGDGGATRARLDRYESVCAQINEFEFLKTSSPRFSKDADPRILAARDQARDHLQYVKEKMFRDRLRKRFALFTAAEMVSNLAQVAPFVSTIVDLVKAFRAAYEREKRRLDVLDFSDLERCAFRLLRADEAGEHPSAVARSLHRRFAHVLVDEFQDINPIQQSILRLASRESDPDRPDNLFAVGDVKQSIYRFRLAEPQLFIDRLNDFRGGSGRGVSVALQENFRSRAPILDTVNLIFRQLLAPGGGPVEYDKEAELRVGRTGPGAEPPAPVELHLVERRIEQDSGDETSELGASDLADPARWSAIEREAFLIGSMVRDWIHRDSLGVNGRPLTYRDIAILLRATKVNAERMAAVLSAMGIPVYAEVGGSLFAAREVRDVMAALQVLDNLQQDVPLAAVLRSAIFGNSLSDDDLVEIRCLDRNVPFYEVVRRYAATGANETLRGHLNVLLARIERYRDEARRRPLADVMWELYERYGHLAYVCGLPHGGQRRANLLKLHDIARRFGTFRKQGLHRFLRFVESLQEDRRELPAAPAIGEADQVIRIMSVHQSKGLEFPVVFVAGLGTRFNLGDRAGRMIFERTAKLGLRVVDPERMVEYASAAHGLAAAEIEKNTRDEELRILYVAMTRAREKLVMVGSLAQAAGCGDLAREVTGSGGPSRFRLVTANTPLDWLLPCLATAPAGVVHGLGGAVGDKPLVEAYVHNASEVSAWSMDHPMDVDRAQVLAAVASGGPLPTPERSALDDPEVEDVVERLNAVYPALAPGTTRSAVAAGEFKGDFDFTRDPEERSHRQRPSRSFIVSGAAGVRGERQDEPVVRGVIMHRVLEHLDFAVAVDRAGVASELQRLQTDNVITHEERTLVDLGGLEWFVASPLAAAIRDAGPAYRREFQYIASEPPSFFDRSAVGPDGDEVLVRGIVDGILCRADGIDVVDFKTDAIGAAHAVERAEHYRPQMELYARAMSRIWRRPVWACWLVFITARAVIELRDPVGD